MVTQLWPTLAARCDRWGSEICDHYTRGGSPNSRAVSYNGAENNPRLQTLGKMAECIFCLELGRDPLRSVKWDLVSDPGYDIDIYGFRYDVKGIDFGYHYLIWSLAKNSIYWDKKFAALVLVKVDVERATGFSRGFILKDDFFSRKQIACHGHALHPGTWYLHEKDLCEMDALLRMAAT